MLAILGGEKVRTAPWPTWPERGEPEERAVLEVLRRGQWGGYPAPGVAAKKFGAAFAEYIGAKHTVLAANGTVTLKIALRALGVGAGDEVIVPALTWVATAGAAAYVNAVPVFVDVDEASLCIDPAAIEAAITDKTRAIIPVHLGSAMADMDAIMDIAKRHELAVIEDCAHAHGAKWNGRGAGSIGDVGSFSFQSSKLLTAGEGGAITTSNDELAQRCQALVNCGRKEPGYDGFEGAVFGWNDRITELQASLLSAQLTRLDGQHERRKKNVARLVAALESRPELGLTVQRRDERITRKTAYELVLLYDSEAYGGVPRDKFVEALTAEGVPADGDFYVPIQDRIEEIFPLRASEYPTIAPRYGAELKPEHAPCPVATRAAYERTVWLHHSLFLGDPSDVDDIIEAIGKIHGAADALS
ncbi:MAG: DegT/DnrJ/EryC1/StrS family aminotransferase [Deltaproteobacteria bacterium]